MRTFPRRLWFALRSAPGREFVSLGLELILWCTVMGWLFYLAADIAQTRSLRSVFEFALLALLVWWPYIRTRIRTGQWPP